MNREVERGEMIALRGVVRILETYLRGGRADEQALGTGIIGAISDGIGAAWIGAERRNASQMLAYYPFLEVVQGWGFPPNREALEAFRTGRRGGMRLSDRVWALAPQVMDDIAGVLTGVIDTGAPASDQEEALRRYLRQYLPGTRPPGVYGTAAANVRRLVATEVNMAYRSAESERWKRQPWVRGYEVHLSGNHTNQGVPFADICDEMVGEYPPDFTFLGWHPHCRCYATPILVEPDELAGALDAPEKLRSQRIREAPTLVQYLAKRGRWRDLSDDGLPLWMATNRTYLESI